MKSAGHKNFLRIVVVAVFAAAPLHLAHAIQFNLDYGDGVQGTLNTVITAGVGLRVQNREAELVGKANNNPDVCGLVNGVQNQSCQGLFRDQGHPAAALAAGPGQAGYNTDDGNLNYDLYDLTQGVLKVTQDLSLKYGDWGFFAKWLYFYDFVNNDFTEFHPNRITRENKDRVGTTTEGANATFGRQYGKGEVVRSKRTDGEILRQIGTDLQLFDAYVFGRLPIYGDKEITFKLGRQTVNWGESTVLVINSVNQINPVNVNNLFRVGFDLSELFTPTNMLFLSFEPFENTTVEAVYGLEWKPIEIPAPGSYFSFLDLGTYDAVNNAGINFGGPAEDPELTPFTTPNNFCNFLVASPVPGGAPVPDSRCADETKLHGQGRPLSNPLSGLTNTSVTIERLRDNNPSDFRQFGLSVKYFADWLGNGTELGFYFLNYASKLPYVSVYAAENSCARHEGNALGGPGGTDVKSGAELLLACPDLPVTHPTVAPGGAGPRGGPENATSNAVPIDTVKLQLEYPEDIQMYGFSFNTTAGDLSLQGEVTYRPNLPLQIHAPDLVFAALQPLLTRCREGSVPGVDSCTGSTSGIGNYDGGRNDRCATPLGATECRYGSSDFNPYPGQRQYKDTFDLSIGASVDSARSFPSFINLYRGLTPGDQAGSNPNLAYDKNNPGYIRGYERFGVWQADLGATYVQGSTDNFFGADQVIWLFEAGAQYVPNLPGTDVLQISAPGTFYHASAGADGSGTGNFAQDCAGTPDCNFTSPSNPNPDGLRFNPHQENLSLFADNFSTGYAIVNLIRYESVFPGISFQPITIFKHDVYGTSVDVANQFTQGRMNAIFLFETRYKEALSLNIGYIAFFGAGSANLQRDRDQALVYAKYQF